MHDSRGVLLHDMSDAEPAWRVAAIVATGILIVASSAVYARASPAVSACTRQHAVRATPSA
jgi:hypothetical protein